MNRENSSKPKYSVGDLVASLSEIKANKRPYTIWKVEGVSFKSTIINGVKDSRVIYELRDSITNVMDLSNENDLILLCTAEYADDYMTQLDEHGNPPSSLSNNKGEQSEISEVVIRDMETNEIISKLPVASMEASIEYNLATIKRAPLELTKREKEDRQNELLDRYNDKLRFAGADGEISEELQEQISEIENELVYLNEAIIVRKA